MWSQLPRQYRRLVVLCGFLGSLSLIYHAGLSANSTCKDGARHSCGEPKLQSEQGGTQTVQDSADERYRPVKAVKNNKDFVVRRGIVDDLALGEKEGSQLRRLPQEKKFDMNSKVADRKEKDSDKTNAKSNLLKINRSKLSRAKFHPKLSPASTKATVTLSKEIRNREITSVYIQIKEADSPRTGDFECAATIVPKCCAISVEDSHDAKHICEGFGKQCKGFVMSTMSSKEDSFEYVIYIKKELNGTMANYLTDFYIKVDYLDELKWNEVKK